MGASRRGDESTPSTPSAPSRGAARRPWLLAVAGLALFALVVALSAVVLRPLLTPGAVPVPPERAQAESARADAATALTRLDDDIARLLRRGGATPAVTAELTSAAEVIAAHRRLLAGAPADPASEPISPSTARATARPTTSDAATGTPSASAVSPATVARGLQQVGVRSLTDAMTLGSPGAPVSTASTSANSSSGMPAAATDTASPTASSTDSPTPVPTVPAPEGGMARVLAATGTAQVQWAARLARVAGVTLPDAAAGLGTPTPVRCVAPTSGTAPSGSDSAASASGSAAGPGSSADPTDSPDDAGDTAAGGSGSGDPASGPPMSGAPDSGAPGPSDAFARAQLTDQRAAYTYDVLRARTGDTLPVATAAARAHRDRLAAAATVARDLCRPVEPQRAAFPVDRAVLDTPARATASMARLERDSALAWGDVVAFGDPALRARAVPLLLDAARAGTAVTGVIDVAPGLSDDLLPPSATATPPASTTPTAESGTTPATEPHPPVSATPTR